MKTLSLRHVAEVRSSSIDKLSSPAERPVRLCNYLDVYNNDRVSPLLDLMTATATLDEVDRFRLQVGDSVITKDSEDPTDIGISAFVDASDEDFVCGYHLALIRPSSRDIYPRYLNWSLRGREVLGYWSSQASGMTRYGLGLNSIKSAPIHVPDLETQRRIANFLDDRVARIDQIIAARCEQSSLASRILASAVSQEFDSREVVPLRRLLARIKTGGTPDESANVAAGLPWYSPGCFTDLLLLDSPVRLVNPEMAARFPGKSVLVVGIGATVGRVAWLDAPGSGNQQVTCLVTNGNLEARFLLHQLNSRRVDLRSVASASTLPILNNEALKDFEIWCPSLEKQRTLADGWDEQLKEVAEQSRRFARSIGLLTEYKSSLITAAVTGRLDLATHRAG